MRELTVLLGCEESQEVCKAFLELGHNASSCDLLPCSGGMPEHHIQGNLIDVIDRWVEIEPIDLVISFPPCTDLAVSGARWFEAKRLSGEQEQSVNFFLDVWERSDAVENPANIMTGLKYIKKWFPQIYQRIKDIKFPCEPSDIIQPWQFGHGETKKTLIWRRRALKNKPLKPTNIVEGREQRIWKMAPGPNRSKERSKTFPGIAKAMAEQWSEDLTLTP